jgi:cell division initiation protein
MRRDDMDRFPRFRKRLWGFDRTEVVAALAKLSTENAEARREIDRLGNEIERLQTAVSERLSGEGDVQRALVAATRVAEEIRKEAEEAARKVRREAEQDGRATVDRLRSEAQSIEGDIDALRARRSEVAASIESLIESLNGELDQIRRESEGEPAGGTLAKTG